MSDMDGTLLGDDRQVSQENREAVAYFTQNGGRFAVATGRSKAGMEYFFAGHCNQRALRHLANGAVVYDFQKKEIVGAEAVGQDGYELALDLAQRSPGRRRHRGVGAGRRIRRARAAKSTRRHFEHVKIPYRPMAPEEIAQPWIKLNLTTDPDKIGGMTAYSSTQAYAGKIPRPALGRSIFMKSSSRGPPRARELALSVNTWALTRTICLSSATDKMTSSFCKAPETAMRRKNAHPDVLRLHPALLPGQ